jgi:hypothetical protein
MQNETKKGSGTNLKVANPPNKNGNGQAWENFGNMFLDAGGRRGTFYFDASVEQLQALLAAAKDGRVKKKVAVFLGGKAKPEAAPAIAA